MTMSQKQLSLTVASIEVRLKSVQNEVQQFNKKTNKIMKNVVKDFEKISGKMALEKNDVFKVYDFSDRLSRLNYKFEDNNEELKDLIEEITKWRKSR